MISHKIMQNFVRSLGVCFALTCCATIYVDKKMDQNVKDYVSTNLEKRVRELEINLNIKFDFLPKVVCDYSGGCSKLSGREFVRRALTVAGSYSMEDNVIYIPTLFHYSDQGFVGFVNHFALNLRRTHVRGTLDHELGHYYACNLMQKYGIEQIMCLNDLDKFRELIIQEGIAEYFKIKMNNLEFNFKESELPKTVSDYSSRTLYDGGAFLVKPIIEKYGEKGILELLRNMPQIEDLFDLNEYQKRTLDKLSKSESSL